MKTLLTIKQQNDWIKANSANSSIEHKWSCRGYGNSKILNRAGYVLAKAGGCGYDRYGTVLGQMIIELFPAEVEKLAKRFCKGRQNYISSKQFYGLFRNGKTGRIWLDGGCGHNCMERILNAIGFELVHHGSTDSRKNSGSEFLSIEPISKYNREFLKNNY